VIAVTAGEAQHPETAIPRAMKTMVFRLIIFYVLAVTVMLLMSPWNEIADAGGSITGSQDRERGTKQGTHHSNRKQFFHFKMTPVPFRKSLRVTIEAISKV
jgi:amino acid permease